jgi:two-component system LytT family response regulator
MQVKCIAIDHQPQALELIKFYISQFPTLHLVNTFNDAGSASVFLQNNLVDLMFVDINMPGISGIELVNSLRIKPIVIFMSAYKKFAMDGFDLEALDYLLKPIKFERFERAVYKAIQFIQYKRSCLKEDKESIFVRSEYRMIKINLSEVEYIESLKDYIKIHQTNEKPVLTLMPLKKVLEKLPGDRFKRIHRSYIVPVDKVKSIYNKKVQLTAKELPMSESYMTFVEEWMKK